MIFNVTKNKYIVHKKINNFQFAQLTIGIGNEIQGDKKRVDVSTDSKVGFPLTDWAKNEPLKAVSCVKFLFLLTAFSSYGGKVAKSLDKISAWVCEEIETFICGF